MSDPIITATQAAQAAVDAQNAAESATLESTKALQGLLEASTGVLNMIGVMQDQLTYKSPTVVVPPNPTPASGYTMTHQTMEPLALANHHIVGQGRSGLQVYGYKSVDPTNEAPVSVGIDNVTVTQGPVEVTWGICANWITGMIRRLHTTGLGVPIASEGGGPKDGHGLYAKLAGYLALLESTFIGNAGNCQLVARPWEGWVPDKLHTQVNGCVFQDCSWQHGGSGGGGSYQLAHYAPTKEGTILEVSDCQFISTIGNGGTWQEDPTTRGQLIAWGEAPATRPGEGYDDWHYERVSVVDCLFDLEAGDRSPIQITHTDKVELRRLTGELRGSWQYESYLPVLADIKRDGRAMTIEIGEVELDCCIRVDGEPLVFADGSSNLRGRLESISLAAA